MRSHTAPPHLPGYTYIRRLGEGSTSQVYLYRQHAPQRDVAIKVSNAPSDDAMAAAFRAEADRMARLSWHPYILSVYDAGTTDDGLEYIVLEYAPGGTCASLMARHPLDIEQMLDLGIKLASALCVAHRAGVVHRDIKPSNVLITASQQPALTDFGVSDSLYRSHAPTGYSPIWAAPEVVTDMAGGTVASDIYSLGALLFAMLAGCSPAEHLYRNRSHAGAAGVASAGSDNAHSAGSQDPRSDIRLFPLPGVDVPAQVQDVLLTALRTDPDDRHHSALTFARALQHAQMALFGHMTPVSVPDTSPYPSDSAQDDPPRLRPEAPRQISQHRPSASEPKNRIGHIGHIPRSGIIGVVVTAIVVIVAAVLSVAMLIHADSVSLAEPVTLGVDAERSDSAASTLDPVVRPQPVPAPDRAHGSFGDGIVVFTWRNPDPVDGDTYLWRIVEPHAAMPEHSGVVNQTTLTLPLTDAQVTSMCISVGIMRANRSISTDSAVAYATR